MARDTRTRLWGGWKKIVNRNAGGGGKQAKGHTNITIIRWRAADAEWQDTGWRILLLFMIYHRFGRENKATTANEKQKKNRGYCTPLGSSCCCKILHAVLLWWLFSRQFIADLLHDRQYTCGGYCCTAALLRWCLSSHWLIAYVLPWVLETDRLHYLNVGMGKHEVCVLPFTLTGVLLINVYQPAQGSVLIN